MGRPAKHVVQEFNGVRYYWKPSGYYKAQHSDGGEYMHRAVWMFYNGEIADGFHVHHLDENRANNKIENLALLPGAEHVRMHSLERFKADPEGFMVGIVAAREAAKRWHASPDGLAWHSKHGKETWANKEKEQAKCAWCGRDYEVFVGAKKRGFCSPSCQGMARKNSGIDDVERACVICGATFKANKYSKTKTCGDSCWRETIRRTRKRL